MLESRVQSNLDQESDLLTFITCGSVDDGKSTLLGRLLHDSQRVFVDQIAHAKNESKKLCVCSCGLWRNTC